MRLAIAYNVVAVALGLVIWALIRDVVYSRDMLGTCVQCFIVLGVSFNQYQMLVHRRYVGRNWRFHNESSAPDSFKFIFAVGWVFWLIAVILVLRGRLF